MLTTLADICAEPLEETTVSVAAFEQSPAKYMCLDVKQLPLLVKGSKAL